MHVRPNQKQFALGALFILAFAPVALAQEPPEEEVEIVELEDLEQELALELEQEVKQKPNVEVRRIVRRSGAFGPQGRPPLPQLLRSPQFQKELGLTEEQQQKLKDIGFNTAKAGIQQSAELRVRRLELARLMEAENPDRAAIDKKLQEISQAQAALSRSRINALLDGRAVLTAEQRAKVKELLQKRAGQGFGVRWMQHRGPGAGGPPRPARRHHRRAAPPPPPPPPAPPQQ